MSENRLPTDGGDVMRAIVNLFQSYTMLHTGFLDKMSYILRWSSHDNPTWPTH